MDQTQTVSTSEVKYAGFWIRFVAAMVDGIILSIATNLFTVLIVLALGLSNIDNPAVMIFTGIISFIAPFVYHILMVYKNEGSTLGKMMVGIKVISSSPEQLSLGNIILRETVGKLISTIIFCAGYIMAAFTEKKQGLHDMIAKTVVVYKDPNKKVSAGLVTAIILAVLIPVIAIVGILASVVLASLGSARVAADDGKNKSLLVSLRSQITVEELSGKKFSCDTSKADANLPSTKIYELLAKANSACVSDDKGYAITIELKNPAGTYCIDSTGKSGKGVIVNEPDAVCKLDN